MSEQDSRISNGQPVPKDVPLTIDSVTCYVAMDPDENMEGIPAFLAEGGLMMPLIAADQEMIVKLRPQAELIARVTGTKMSLVRFTTREVLIEDILADRPVEDDEPHITAIGVEDTAAVLELTIERAEHPNLQPLKDLRIHGQDCPKEQHPHGEECGDECPTCISIKGLLESFEREPEWKDD